MIKKIIFAALLLIFSMRLTDCCAQHDNLKSFLFLSTFCEYATIYPTMSSLFVDGFYQSYDDFSYECTQPLDVPVDTFSNTPEFWNYKIQLFRLKKYHKPYYYLLKVNPCMSLHFDIGDTLWLRISGYQESDVKVFFDFLRKQGVKKRDIIDMVDEWKKADEMFREIDWDCILNGYFKNNTHCRCYLSWSKLYYERSHWKSSRTETEAYADFSKKPLGGQLRP